MNFQSPSRQGRAACTQFGLRQEAIDQLALDAAVEQAWKSLREGGIPIGAALVNPSGVAVALGHNLRVQTGDPTAHAETVCMRNAGRRRDWPMLTMATTLSPCAMCSGTAVLHRLRRMVIGEHRTFRGREDWLRGAGIEVRVIDDLRCVAMMERFIETHSELWDEDIGVPPPAGRVAESRDARQAERPMNDRPAEEPAKRRRAGKAGH